MRKYNREGRNHVRNIPCAYLIRPELGRTSISLDPLTDSLHCDAAVYTSPLWRAAVSMEEMRRALATHPSGRGYALANFNIDVTRKAVAGVAVEMTVEWFGKAA